jgi:proline iminopeptidase
MTPLEDMRTLIYLEPRGIGRSERLEDPGSYAMREYVEDLEALRSYFQLPRIAIAGHSHGGFVALKYAIQYPEKVERLLLISTAPYSGLADSEEWARQREGFAEMQASLTKELADETLTPNEKLRRRLSHRLPALHFHDYRTAEPIFAPLLRNMVVSSEPFDYFLREEMATYDVSDLLDRITAPTLIIRGDDDLPAEVTGSQILNERIPKSELKVISECGHWPILERPQAFFEAVEPFLRSP